MMRMAAGVCLALLGLGCARSGTARAAEPVPFQVRGVVVYAATRQPASRVLIRVEEVNAGALTDHSGAFHVRGHARPGRYLLTVSRLGFRPRTLNVRIRRAGTVDVGTVAVRASVVQIDDLVAPECLEYDRPPADTAPGQIVRARTDSTGTVWLICRPTTSR